MWYSEKLDDDDEEFELIGDVSEAQRTDDSNDNAANGNNIQTTDGLYHCHNNISLC